MEKAVREGSDLARHLQRQWEDNLRAHLKEKERNVTQHSHEPNSLQIQTRKNLHHVKTDFLSDALPLPIIKNSLNSVLLTISLDFRGVTLIVYHLTLRAALNWIPFFNTRSS